MISRYSTIYPNRPQAVLPHKSTMVKVNGEGLASANKELGKNMTRYCPAGKIILVFTAVVHFVCPGMYDMNNNTGQ